MQHLNRRRRSKATNILASAAAGITAIAMASRAAHAAGTFLFDATKAEMAGNADWVVDADLHNLGTGSGGAMVAGAGTESNPQQFPTPANPVNETDWSGAISSWGVALVQNGYGVQSLPYNGRITYGDSTNPQDLSNYKVYVVDEPNILFTASEKTAILQFVRNGGGLFLISDHSSSDRNNDGEDSPVIWNDFFNNNGNIANPFGIQFNDNNVSGDYTLLNTSANSPLMTGIGGNVSHLAYHNGSEITIDTTKNPSVVAAVWSSSTSPNSHVVAASATYGLGRVVAIGDSSPIDDGTGDPNDSSLFTGWTDDGGKQIGLNGSAWLAIAVANGIWTGTANATWDAPANWSNGIKPSGAIAVALNTPIPATGATITLTNGESASSLAFNDSYSLTGGTVSLSGGSINVSPGVTASIASNLNGASGLTLTGAGTLVLSGSNTYTGLATISPGSTLQIGTGGLTGSIPGNVLNNGTLAFNRSNTITYAGNVSGSGAMNKLGAGTLIITGSNTYTGITTITAGTLQLGNAGPAGSITGPIVDNSNLTFNHSDDLTYSGAITGTGSITKNGANTVSLNNLRIGSVSINAGTLHILPSNLSPTSTNTLAAAPVIGAAGQLDIEDNALIITYPPSDTTHSVRDTIRNLLINGRNGAPGQPGAWNGLGGIVSTFAHANGNGFNLAIGYADNEDIALVRGSGSYTSFGGQTVSSNTVLVQMTRGADATLDGVVDAQDVTILGSHFMKPNSGQWCFGDFDYSGTCDATDVTTLGSTFGKTSPALSPAQMTAEFGAAFTQAFEAGQSGAVPEPSTAILFLPTAGYLLRRGRRRRRFAATSVRSS